MRKLNKYFDIIKHRNKTKSQPVGSLLNIVKNSVRFLSQVFPATLPPAPE